MPKNVGLIDKIVRFIIAVGLVVFGLLNISSGLWWVGLIAVVPLVTGIAGYYAGPHRQDHYWRFLSYDHASFRLSV